MSNITTITKLAETIATNANVELSEQLCQVVSDYVANPDTTFKVFCEQAGINRRKYRKSLLDEAVASFKEHQPQQINRRAFSKQWRAYAVKLINQGKYTRKDIIAKAVERYEGQLTESCIATFLSDAKNPKYCANCGFDQAVVLLPGKLLAPATSQA